MVPPRTQCLVPSVESGLGEGRSGTTSSWFLTTPSQGHLPYPPTTLAQLGQLQLTVDILCIVYASICPWRLTLCTEWAFQARQWRIHFINLHSPPPKKWGQDGDPKSASAASNTPPEMPIPDTDIEAFPGGSVASWVFLGPWWPTTNITSSSV